MGIEKGLQQPRQPKVREDLPDAVVPLLLQPAVEGKQRWSWCGYGSKAWCSRYHKIAGEWMGVPPNISKHDNMYSRFWPFLTHPHVWGPLGHWGNRCPEIEQPPDILETCAWGGKGFCWKQWRDPLVGEPKNHRERSGLKKVIHLKSFR